MNHKATVAGVAIAVLLMLLAGVGYAVTYTATTTNTQNTIDAKYITVVTKLGDSEDYTDFLASIDFDTANSGGAITYTPHYDSKIGGSATNNAALVSTASWKVLVSGNNLSGTYNLAVGVSDFTPVAGLTYTMIIGDKTATYSSGWAFTGLTIGTTYDVALYVSGPATAAPSTVGFTNYSADPAVTGSVFTYTATQETV